MIGHVAAEARPPRGPDCKAQGGRDGVAQEERMKDGADGRKEEQERVQRESVELRLDFKGDGDDGGEGKTCILKGR